MARSGRNDLQAWDRSAIGRMAGSRLLVLSVLAFLAAVFPALAQPQQQQFHNPFSDLLRLFSPSAPSQQPAAPAAPRPARKRPPPAAAATVSDRPVVPKVEPTVFVTVIGDSLAENLAAGLTDAFEDNPEVQVSRRTRTSSGLVRDDFFDWRRTAREIASGPDRITHAVVMLGSNDRQPLRDASGAVLDPFSEAWRAAYAARVGEVVAAFSEKQIPVVWVGMPVMENARFAADMLALNEISRNAAEKAGATYVDMWEPFLDAQNKYSATGPDVNGDMARLRSSDGIHFTKAGARKAAHFVEIDLKRGLDERPPASVVTIPTETMDPASGDPALQPGGVERIIDEIARRGIDGDPVVVTIPVKPPAGPVIQLTGVEPTPGAALMQRLPMRSFTEAGRIAEEVLVDGKTPEPKPGRADDFRWPPK
jgi:hypothetical protein